MHIEKPLKREILIWFITYSTLLSSVILYRYVFFKYALYSPLWPIIRWLNLLMFGITILLPIIHIGILGLVASFFMLIFAHQYLNLRGWRLISNYMLPHPFVVSLFQAYRAYFYHATDTPPWGWLLFGGMAYILLVVAAYMISRLFMRFWSEPK